jgi:hypothetical protein
LAAHGRRLWLAAAAAAAVLAYLAAGLPLATGSVSGETWSRLSVSVVDARLRSPLGVAGIELVYAHCSPLGCGNVSSMLLEPRPGAGADLGWAVLYNVGLRLEKGVYIPASEIATMRQWLLNASWSSSLADGWALLRLEPSGARVRADRCPGGPMWRLVSRSPCVVEPRSPLPLLLEARIDPVYGARGGLRVALVASPLLRAAAALGLAGLLYALLRRR